MINLYRDPSGEHVFSGFDEANFRAPQLSTVFRNNVECTGCQQLLEEVKTLKKHLDRVLIWCEGSVCAIIILTDSLGV